MHKSKFKVNPFLTEVSPLQEASNYTAERPATVSQQETPTASLIVYII